MQREKYRTGICCEIHQKAAKYRQLSGSSAGGDPTWGADSTADSAPKYCHSAWCLRESHWCGSHSGVVSDSFSTVFQYFLDFLEIVHVMCTQEVSAWIRKICEILWKIAEKKCLLQSFRNIVIMKMYSISPYPVLTVRIYMRNCPPRSKWASLMNV